MPRVLRADHLHLEAQHLVEQRGLSEILVAHRTGRPLPVPVLHQAQPYERTKNAGHHGETWKIVCDGLAYGVHNRTGRGEMVGARPFMGCDRQTPKDQPGMMLRPELQRVPVEILKVHLPEHGLE